MSKRLTIRFTDAEWDALERKARNRPLSTYAREKLLGDAAKSRKTQRRPKADDILLAQILATLGQSELPKSMRTIANAALDGTVVQDGDLLLNLRIACLTIEKIRHDLTAALGIKPE